MALDVRLSSLITLACFLNTQVYDQVWALATSDAWGQWSEWASCSVECGPGLQDRSRTCLKYGACSAGNEIQSRLCENKACPDSLPSYRQKACSRYDRRVFSGKQYMWEPFIHASDPCKLACRAKGVHFYANLASRVRDGELCHKEGQPVAVCFRGVCKPVGCDDVVLSPAHVDKCGVCNGDGTGCKTVAGIFTKDQMLRGLNPVITIPAGSTSINITELSPSENLLILQAASGKVFINAGHGRPTSGTIKAAGTMFQYIGKTSVNPKESILSRGPTNATVLVKLLSRGSNPGIAYTFSVPQDVNDSYIHEITGGVIVPPTVKTAPLFIKDNTLSHTQDIQSELTSSHENDKQQYTNEDTTQTSSDESDESASPTSVVASHMYSLLARRKEKERAINELNNSNGYGRKVENVRKVGVTPHYQYSTYSVEVHTPDTDSMESSGDMDVDIKTPGYSSRDDQMITGEKRQYDSTTTMSSNDASEDNDSDESSDDESDEAEEEDGQNVESNDTGDDDDDDDNDDDDDENEQAEQDGSLIKSMISDHKINYNDNEDDAVTEAKYLSQERQQSVRIPLNSVVNPNEVPGWEDRNKVNVTYFDSNKMIEKFDNDDDDNDDSDATNVVFSTTSPSSFPKATSSRQNSRRFKIPKFSTSFTFASRYKNSPSLRRRTSNLKNVGKKSGTVGSNTSIEKSRKRSQLSESSTESPQVSNTRTDKIRIREVHHKAVSRGYRARALESAPITTRDQNYFAQESLRNERRRMAEKRQTMIEERNKRMQKRMEEYNRRLQEHRKKLQMRRREHVQKHSSRGTSLERGRSSIKNLNAEVKVSPSSPLSPSSSYEKSVHIVSTGKNRYKVVEKQPIIRRISSPNTRTPFNQEPTSSFTGGTRERVVDVIPRTRSYVGKKVNPRINADKPSKNVIPQTSGHQKATNPISSQVPRNVKSRTSETSKANPSLVSNPQGATKTYISNSKELVTVLANGRQIIYPGVSRPRYISNERGSLTSALDGNDIPEGGAPVVIPATKTDVIPNRVETNEYNNVETDPRGANKKPLKTLTSREDVIGFYNNEWRISGLTECTHSCGGGVQQTVVVCVDTRTQAVVTDENCRQVQRPDVKAVTCNKRPCPAQWVPSLWTPCSVTCGDGEQTRTVTCQARVSPTLNLTMSESRCQNLDSPVQRQNCNPQPCSSWSVGNWSECSADCGEGVRSRTIRCVGLDRRQLDDDQCDSTKPKKEEKCTMGSCGKGWFFTPWPEECPVACGTGVITRRVFCISGDGQAIPESRCDIKHQPETSRACRVDTPCGGSWYTGLWSKCNVTCGKGFKSREVLCVKSLPGRVFAVVDDENCATSPKPLVEDICIQPQCQPEWYTTSWGQCSQSCDTGYRTREIKCLNPSQRNSDQCSINDRPRTRESCNNNVCRKPIPTRKTATDNGECTDKFTQCRIVKRARLCKYKYYKKMCCKSCL